MPPDVPMLPKVPAKARSVPKAARTWRLHFTAVLVYNHAMTALLDLGLHALRSAYRAGTLDVRPGDRGGAEAHRRRRRRQGVDITRCPTPRCASEAATASTRGAARSDRLPLYGVPFAVKDNIDVAGLPTTAACPASPTQPSESADGRAAAGRRRRHRRRQDQPRPVRHRPGRACARPTACRAIRSIRRSCRAARARARRSPSRAGWSSFALGTDTAGSGRVPAGFNNIVGLKPTPGLLSNDGVVPACQSLDCVSVFALSCADADAVLKVAAEPPATPAIGKAFRFGVLRPPDAEFFGDERLCRALRAGDRAPEGAWAARRSRSTTRRFRDAAAAALWRPVGRRAHGGGRRVHRRRRRRGRRLAGHAPDHPARPRLQRRRRLRGPVRARRL